jgi:hypothetical protein
VEVREQCDEGSGERGPEREPQVEHRRPLLDDGDAHHDRDAQVRDVADRIGATPAQVALAWLVAQGPHVVPIPGTKTPKYLGRQRGRRGRPAVRGRPRRPQRHPGTTRERAPKDMVK